MYISTSHQSNLNRSSRSLLPLSVLARLEGLQDSDHPLQGGDLLLHCGNDLGLIITQLRKEVLAVRGRRHGSTEERLHHERVVRLESAAVGFTEGISELLGGVVEVVAEGLSSEVETTKTMSVALCVRRRRMASEMPLEA